MTAAAAVAVTDIGPVLEAPRVSRQDRTSIAPGLSTMPGSQRPKAEHQGS